jgi:hypothetical protein
MALNNLRSEVIELRNEGLEKDKILISMVNKVKEDKANYKAHAEAQKTEIEDLRRQLAEANERCALAQDNRPRDYKKRMKKTPMMPGLKQSELKRLLNAKGIYVLFFWFFSFGTCFCGFELIDLPTSAELSPPPEPYDALADPEMKEALDIISMADSIIDGFVDKLLNEVAEKVLREE